MRNNNTYNHLTLLCHDILLYIIRSSKNSSEQNIV